MCLTFDREEGNTCSGCRSIPRIRDIYCGGFLLRGQEGKALEVLRSCVGALTDLAEIAAPILAKEKAVSGPAEPPLTPGNISRPLGVPSAPVVDQLLESEKAGEEVVKTEEDEKKESDTTPGVGELKPAEPGSESKGEGGRVGEAQKEKKEETQATRLRPERRLRRR